MGVNATMKITITRSDPTDPLVRAFAEPLSLEGEIEFRKLEAVEALLQFMKREGITRSELANRMGVPPSRITRLLGGAMAMIFPCVNGKGS